MQTHSSFSPIGTICKYSNIMRTKIISFGIVCLGLRMTRVDAFNFPGTAGAQAACAGFSAGALKCVCFLSFPTRWLPPIPTTLLGLRQLICISKLQLTDVSYVICNAGNEYEQFVAPGTHCVKGERCKKQDHIAAGVATATSVFAQDAPCSPATDAEAASTTPGVASISSSYIVIETSSETTVSGYPAFQSIQNSDTSLGSGVGSASLATTISTALSTPPAIESVLDLNSLLSSNAASSSLSTPASTASSIPPALQSILDLEHSLSSIAAISSLAPPATSTTSRETVNVVSPVNIFSYTPPP